MSKTDIITKLASNYHVVQTTILHTAESKFMSCDFLSLFLISCAFVACNSPNNDLLKQRLPELANRGALDSTQIEMLERFVAIHRGQNSTAEHNEFTSETSDTITYEELANIFYANCRTCHTNDGTAPFVFEDYTDILRKAKTIKKVLTAGIMPPWSPVSDNHHFSNAPPITKDEISKVIKWIDDGAYCPKSQREVLIDDLVKDKSLEVLIPDLTASAGYDHIVSKNTDTYHCKVIDLNLDSTEFLRGIKPVSTNPTSLHHITIYLDTTGILGENGENWDCLYGDMVKKLIPFDTWSKGFKFYAFDTNFHCRLPKNSKLMLQVHYDQHLQGQAERTSINLYRAEKSKASQQIKWIIQGNDKIAIPADSVKLETITHYVDKDISLLSVIPHMHYVGRMMEIYAIDSNGIRTDLLRIDNWDYAFQGRYMLKHPKKIDKGSTIIANFIYDNTVYNPYQPNNPPVDVFYRLGSKQEMMVLSFYYVDYQKGDDQKTIGNVAI